MNKTKYLIIVSLMVIISLFLLGCETATSIGDPIIDENPITPVEPIDEEPSEPVDSNNEEPSEDADSNNEEPSEPVTPSEPKKEEPKKEEPKEIKEPAEPSEPVKTPDPVKPAEPKDTTPPVLNGVNDVTLNFGESFDLRLGVTATDSIDGDLTSKIEIIGSLDVRKSGSYTITYKVKDKAGNEASKTRKIIVRESKFTFNQELTNIAIEQQRAYRHDFNDYADRNGEKVEYFDSVLMEMVRGELTPSQVIEKLDGYQWVETSTNATHGINRFSMYARIGTTTATDGVSLLNSAYYINRSGYNRVRVYTNEEGLNKVYWLQFTVW